ncbi:MAG: aminodeoxychorismate synthase component I [Proteocatella sp.]
MNLHFEIQSIKTKLNGFEIYQCIEKGEDHIFLDSSKEDSPYSRYSIIGANPFLTIKYENKKIYEKWYGQEIVCFKPAENQIDIFSYLNNILNIYKADNKTKLPFIGGALGYCSYDLGSEMENLKSKAPALVEIPEVYFVFYDNAIILDHRSGEVSVTGFGIMKDAKISVADLVCQIEKCENSLINKDIEVKDCNIDSPKEARPVFESPFDETEYKETVEKMRNYIREGHIYIANMTHTFAGDFKSDPLKTYEKLRRINPAPFSAFLPLEDFTVLSSSPERFIEIRAGKVQTRPIKGTRARGSSLEEDNQNREELRNSEKDRSELLMIVDLERNDLNKVCMPGSVKVTELFQIEEYATVFHLVATIEGRLMPGNTSVDCIKATFPGGSITGAPKIRAMEIIDELEKSKRNIYTGSIGYLGFDGNLDLNIVIRSILMKDERAYIGVGGGVTWESESQAEYDETIAKAIALFKSLEADYIA